MREKNILRFDISVSITFSVHVIQSIHHLMEISSGYDFREFSSIGNKIEELASSDIFQNDGKTFVSRFILLFVGGILSDVNKTY